MKHNAWTYNNHGCRCVVCTKGWRDYMRDYSHRAGINRPMAQYLAERYPEPPPHGTESRYVGHSCRCVECREASRVARARRRARVAA